MLFLNFIALVQQSKRNAAKHHSNLLQSQNLLFVGDYSPVLCK